MAIFEVTSSERKIVKKRGVYMLQLIIIMNDFYVCLKIM